MGGVTAPIASSGLAEGARLTLDLRNMYFVDCEGVEPIKRLLDRGARQANAPLFVAELGKCEAEPGDRVRKRAKLMRRRLLIKRRLQRGRLRAWRARAKEFYGRSPTEF
jgi:hypothetical protein